MNPLVAMLNELKGQPMPDGRELFPEPNTCAKCLEPLEQLALPEVEVPARIMLGRWCRACEEREI